MPQHRAEPRHAGQCGERDRCRVVGAAPGGAGDRHQILRLASRAVQDAGTRKRSAPHAARLLFRSDRLAHVLSARQALGLGGAAAADLVRLCAGNADEFAPAIAVFAAISKELGLPLRFPGKPGAYASIYQVTESSTSPTRRSGRQASRAAGSRLSTSPMATISAGRTCGRSSPPPSTWRPATADHQPYRAHGGQGRRCGAL